MTDPDVCACGHPLDVCPTCGDNRCLECDPLGSAACDREARSGVGNSSGVQESTHTVEGAQNGAQSLPGAFQPNRNPQEAP